MFTQHLVYQLAGVKNIVKENAAKWKSFWIRILRNLVSYSTIIEICYIETDSNGIASSERNIILESFNGTSTDISEFFEFKTQFFTR
jgi:hypothetical protein